MKAETIKPTDKEIEILHILWQKKEVSVKEVHEELGGETTNGYTTILKIMQIMNEKGLVTRQKSGKLHLYKAVTSPENTKTQLLDKMINTVFQGSASQMVMSALGNGKPSKEELKEIRSYLDQLEGGIK
ncbi:MAG TPA: BlaI/MecI/CopY family transcriptional regulator [Cyclobacteriaceae bacterium]